MKTNIVVIIGNVGQAPNVKYTVNGKSVASFSICINDGPKGTDGKYGANWFEVVAFDKLAEIVGEHVDAGSKLCVHGRLTVNKWTDQEGKQQSRVKIVANSLDFLSTRKETEEAAPVAPVAEEVSF
jgi:single-strand DNA-binding protein